MDHRELEDTLARLPSVTAVRIAVDGDRVSEVHVLAASGKSPKQVVRDVQTLALARYGVDIDRRVISVVQIGPGSLATDDDRPAILGVHEIPEGARTTVAVTLQWRGDEHVGTASGPAAPSARLRLVGEAALRAVEGILGDALALDAIGAPSIGMRRVVVALVVGSGVAGDEVAVGSALSQGDDSETAVRAVLDALNRRISRSD